MPNFELSETHRYDMRSACSGLCNIRLRIVEQGFPLSQKDIEQGMLPAEMRDLFYRLKELGADSLRNTSDPVIFVGGPGIERPAALHITGIQRVWYAYQEQDNISGYEVIKQSKGHVLDKKLFFDNSVLEPETYAKLVKWVNACVREHRQAELTRATVAEFTQLFAPTLGHVIARWPGLRLLFERMEVGSRAQNSWAERVYMLPKTKHRWDWATIEEKAWRAKHARIMEVCDEMLVGAAMLRRPLPVGIQAQVRGWRRKEGEKI